MFNQAEKSVCVLDDRECMFFCVCAVRCASVWAILKCPQCERARFVNRNAEFKVNERIEYMCISYIVSV